MRCFQVNAEDNVATALEDLEPGPVTVMGAHGGRQIQALEPIALGHKLSLQGIGGGFADQVWRAHRRGYHRYSGRTLGAFA